MSVVDSLYPEFIKFIDGDLDRMKWFPDYVVIAGDVADKNGSYSSVKALIEHIRSSNAFNIPADHIIVVPGNHDKDAKLSVSEMVKAKKVFDQYCENCNEQTVKDFGDVFIKHFKKFNRFSAPYNDKLRFNTKGKKCVLDNRLRKLSGVKVFEEDHLCFLYVNTEWLYMYGKSDVMVLSKKTCENLSDFMVVDEKCQLCAPLIKDACDLINSKYKDYTVVTVMHRGFEHFAWEEKNITDKLEIDAIDYLLRTSDVIISGHDHVFSPGAPTFLRNKVEHFQLGLVGQKESKTSEFPRSAEIIRLNASGGYIEQLIISHDKKYNNSHWVFTEVNHNYPLLYKSMSQSGESPKPSFRDTLIWAKSSNKKDIESAIELYFQKPENFDLIPVDANKNMIQRLNALVNETNAKPLYVVVYYHSHEYFEKAQTNLQEIVLIKQQLDSFRDKHIGELMNGQLFINEVVIEYPLNDPCVNNGFFCSKKILTP